MTSLLIRITLIDILLLLIGSWPILHFWGADVLIAVIAGFAVMTVAAAITYKITERSRNKTNNQYMAAVFGGMGVKIGLLLAAIVVVYLLELLHGLGFTLGVLISYIYKSVIEIYLLVKTTNSQQPEQANETIT